MNKRLIVAPTVMCAALLATVPITSVAQQSTTTATTTKKESSSTTTTDSSKASTTKKTTEEEEPEASEEDPAEEEIAGDGSVADQILQELEEAKNMSVIIKSNLLLIPTPVFSK